MRLLSTKDRTLMIFGGPVLIVFLTLRTNHLTIFYDPYQNIFEKEPTLPDGLPHFVLGENCRNTVCIAGIAQG